MSLRTFQATVRLSNGFHQEVFVRADSQSNARQLWWWVLNFTVCFGILWLISRRRKAAKD